MFRGWVDFPLYQRLEPSASSQHFQWVARQSPSFLRHHCVTVMPRKNRPALVRLCWIPATCAWTRCTKPLIARIFSGLKPSACAQFWKRRCASRWRASGHRSRWARPSRRRRSRPARRVFAQHPFDQRLAAAFRDGKVALADQPRRPSTAHASSRSASSEAMRLPMSSMRSSRGWCG